MNLLTSQEVEKFKKDGAIFLRKKFDIICPLTTVMQYWRGYPCKDKRNYSHSFIAELSQKLRIKIHYKGVNIVLLITLIIVFIQYFF